MSKTKICLFVAVPDRNRILVHRVFRPHQQVQRATALSFRLGRGSYALRGRTRYSCVYIARMSSTLSGSLALQRVKLGDALEIRNGIIFDFYSGLPHLYIYIFIYMVRAYSVYIYILPHLCAMQYFHIACWFTTVAQETRLAEQNG